MNHNASHLRESADGVLLSIKVQPRASRNGIGEVLGNELKISVTAPPVDDAANAAVAEFLAKRLNCAKGHVHLVKGRASRHKVFLIKGVSPAQILEKLSRP